MKALLHIVLVQPEIPPNTGNIARLCACNGLDLHLVHPLGFRMDKKSLERASMDYLERVRLREYDDWDHFYREHPFPDKFYFFSSKARQPLWETAFQPESYLIFGSESRGLGQDLRTGFPDHWVCIPMLAKETRCLNLSTAAAAGTYEALRQINGSGKN